MKNTINKIASVFIMLLLSFALSACGNTENRHSETDVDMNITSGLTVDEDISGTCEEKLTSSESIVVTTEIDGSEEKILFYDNVLNTINSLKQIHLNPDSIELLGAVVMNPNGNNPRTVIYISYVGLDEEIYTDYFWKDMNELEIKAIFAQDCYSGHNGRMPIEKMEVSEIVKYEKSGAYIPELTPTSMISLEK